MTRIKMHIFNVKLLFYTPCEVKYGLQNRVSTLRSQKISYQYREIPWCHDIYIIYLNLFYYYSFYQSPSKNTFLLHPIFCIIILSLNLSCSLGSTLVLRELYCYNLLHLGVTKQPRFSGWRISHTIFLLSFCMTEVYCRVKWNLWLLSQKKKKISMKQLLFLHKSLLSKHQHCWSCLVVNSFFISKLDRHYANVVCVIHTKRPHVTSWHE